MTYAAPPARTEISDTYPNPSNAVARAGFGKLWDYVTGLLGSTGNPAAAKAALLVPVDVDFTNRIINGAMMIDQRNSGASVIVASGDVTFDVDRWLGSSSQASKFTLQQSTTAPSGFKNSMVATVVSTITVGAGDYAGILQRVEGLNTYDLGWGAAGASAITVSFWVRSSITGTYCVAIRNSGDTRSYVSTYTINSANTWEQKSITITGDIAGTWSSTNGIGLVAYFTLSCGSTFGSATANTWSGSLGIATNAQTQWIQNAGATFYITGVQLEKGTAATTFALRPYGTELALCQRYCPVFDASTGVGARILGYGRSTTSVDVSFNFPVTLRTPPTGITVSSASNFSIFNPANGGSGAVTALTFNLGDMQGSILSAATTAGTPTIAGGSLLQLYPNSTSAKIIFNGCEL